MKHVDNWTDLYGAVHACFQGRSGGHRWLVALPESAAQDLETAVQALSDLDGKGRVDLVVYPDPQAVRAAAAELRPRGVLLLSAETPPTGGNTGAAPNVAGEMAGNTTGDVAGDVADDLGDLQPRRVSVAGAGAALAGWLAEVPHGR